MINEETFYLLSSYREIRIKVNSNNLKNFTSFKISTKMNSNFITKFLLLINYLIIYRIVYYAINDTNLHIVNHIKPNKSTEYIKIIKKKKTRQL